jgi:hypothetical protein
MKQRNQKNFKIMPKSEVSEKAFKYKALFETLGTKSSKG